MVQCANYWSMSSMGNREFKHEEDIKSIIERWDKANSIYYGPDRDFKNYPTLRIPEHTPPTRLGIFPDRWFDAFYSKTGVTGPYMFMVSSFVFLMSKEYIVVDHNSMEVIIVGGALYMFVRLLGKRVRDYTNKYNTDFMEKYWYEPIRETIDEAQANVDNTATQIQQQGRLKYLYEAKRENVDLQLETAYRQRLAEVHQAVKKRLDYQVEKENAVKRFEQNHMVNWIIRNVMKSITPQQEKDTLNRCIQDLKALSATVKV